MSLIAFGDNNDPQEKDVTIIVGELEFKHSSHMLRYSSQFFDAMFSHDLRERNEMVVRFPDKDPKDWEIVKLFLEPGVAQPRITEKNVHLLLPWFDHLCMTSNSLMEACDEVYPAVFEKALEDSPRYDLHSHVSRDVDQVIFALQLGFKYSLAETKKSSMALLIRCLGHEAAMYTVHTMQKCYLGTETDVWEIFSGACCNGFLGDATDFETLLQQQGTERNGFQPKERCEECWLWHHRQTPFVSTKPRGLIFT